MLTTEKKKYTVADYEMLEEGAPFQLINYDLVMSPSPLSSHQLISGKIFIAISNFIATTNNGGIVMYAPIDVKFDDGNVFQPDLIYISAENKSIIQARIEGVPDIVFEILSPSNAYYDLRQKKDVYEKYGVKEYIIIDPVAQNAEVHTLENGVYILQQKAQLNERLASVKFKGLELDLTQLFS